MKMFVSLLVAFALAGCGGIGGECAGFGAGIDPFEFTLPVSGQTVLEANAMSCSSSLQSYVWSIQEGSAGGTVVGFVQDGRKFATYTAPAEPGTYHVQVLFRFHDGMELVPVSVVTVTPP